MFVVHAKSVVSKSTMMAPSKRMFGALTSKTFGANHSNTIKDTTESVNFRLGRSSGNNGSGNLIALTSGHFKDSNFKQQRRKEDYYLDSLALFSRPIPIPDYSYYYYNNSNVLDTSKTVLDHSLQSQPQAQDAWNWNEGIMMTREIMEPPKDKEKEEIIQAMNRNARRPKRANHGARPCSRHSRRSKKEKIGKRSRG